MRWLVTAMLGVLVTGCWWIQSADDRRDCDRAIDSICNGKGIDCAGRPPAVVDVLRRCESDEIYRNRGYHLAVCITDSPTYAKIVAALDTQDQAICAMTCSREAACDAAEACHAFQYASCGAAHADGGPDAS